MPFTFTNTELEGVMVVEPREFADERGSFAEAFKQSDFVEAGITESFTQFNLSRSEKDVIRGLHYQLDPLAQGKLITVVTGEVMDVVVDLREGSPTFKQWISIALSASPLKGVYVPAGFAHGFYVTSDHADVMYFCTKEYAPEAERGIMWNDPELAINWPGDNPKLSEKDKQYPKLADAEHNFTYS